MHQRKDENEKIIHVGGKSNNYIMGYKEEIDSLILPF